MPELCNALSAKRGFSAMTLAFLDGGAWAFEWVSRRWKAEVVRIEASQAFFCALAVLDLTRRSELLRIEPEFYAFRELSSVFITFQSIILITPMKILLKTRYFS